MRKSLSGAVVVSEKRAPPLPSDHELRYPDLGIPFVSDESSELAYTLGLTDRF